DTSSGRQDLISCLERNHSLRSGKMPSSPPLHGCARLAFGRCLDHNDSSVSRVTPTPRGAGHLVARKESAHEDHTPRHDAPAPTHVGKYAAAQLLAPHYRLLPPLCRRFRAAFQHLPRTPGPRAGPHLSTLSRPGETALLVLHRADGLCIAFLLPRHPRASGD